MTMESLCGEATSDRKSDGGCRRMGLLGVFSEHVVIDGQFGKEVAMDGAQRRQAGIERFADGFEPGDLVVELVGQPVRDVVFAQGLSWRTARARVADAGGQAQGLAAEQDHRRGPWLPSQDLVQAQQRPDLWGPLIASAANFDQGVGAGTATSGHLFFGEVQLRHPQVGEVNEALDALTGNGHRPHPTGGNGAYLVVIPDGRFPSHISERLSA